jgi:hypothetical protein
MAINAKYPGLLGINELQNNIIELQTIFNKIKHKTQEERNTHNKFFNDWDNFYDQFIGQAQLIDRATMQSLNDKYNNEVRIIDQIAKRSLETEKQSRQQQLERQAQIDEQDRQRYEREQQLARQAQIDIDDEERYEREKLASSILAEQDQIIVEPAQPEPVPVKATTHGTGDYPSLSKSWNAVIDLWDRIENRPDPGVVATVDNSISAWLDFYEGEVQYWFTLGRPVPDALKAQLSKWRDRYNKTRKVVETAASQSKLLFEAPTAPALAPEHIKLAPGEVYDPTTGMIKAPEILIKGMVAKPGVRPSPVPRGVLPSPWIPPPEPPYKPPPTIIIKQNYPPVEPSEPSIDPDQPIIIEPGPYRTGEIGGLIDPRVVDDGDDPFEIEEKVKSNWPWLVGLGTLIFLAKAWRR